MPSTPFGLLLVEGGDELAVCRILGDQVWSQLCAWKADGRDLPGLARLAQNDPGFYHARSVGIVLDVEGDVAAAHRLAAETVAVLGRPRAFAPGVFSGSPKVGVFLVPDGSTMGALETLCRRAIRDHALARCVDDLIACSGRPHTQTGNPQALEDKGWLRAYLGMLPEPVLRFHQAFDHPQGIDARHAAFDDLRAFILAL